MADKNTRNGAEEVDSVLEGFEEVDWGGDATPSAPAPSSSSKSSVFDEEDPFSDGGAAQAENFFEIEEMPDAQSSDEGFGDDFNDLSPDGDDAPSSSYSDASAVGQDEDPFGGDEPFESDDAQASGSEGTDGDYEYVDDPFADVPNSSAAEDTAAPAAAEASPPGLLSRHRNMLLGIVGVAAAAVGVVYVAPMFLSGGPAVVVTQPSAIQSAETTFPTTLPTKSTAGQETPAVMPPLNASPDVPLATAPSLSDLPKADSGAEAKPSTPSLTFDLPAVETAGEPKTTVEEKPAPAETAVAKSDPFDDLVGGRDRGGIDAVKSAAPVASNSTGRDYAKELDALIARLESLEGKVDHLAEGFDQVIQARPSAGQKAPQTQVSEIPTPAASDAVPPMKPPIVETATLKGVAGDLAWVSTKSGVVEVRVGDTVPNAGKVVAIRNYRSQWIVVTTDGLIVRQ